MSQGDGESETVSQGTVTLTHRFLDGNKDCSEGAVLCMCAWQMETADTQIKQKTSREGCPAENRVEAEGMQESAECIRGIQERKKGRQSLRSSWRTDVCQAGMGAGWSRWWR